MLEHLLGSCHARVMTKLCTTHTTEGLVATGAYLATLAGLNAHREGLSQGTQLVGHAQRQLVSCVTKVLLPAAIMPMPYEKFALHVLPKAGLLQEHTLPCLQVWTPTERGSARAPSSWDMPNGSL